MDPAALVQSLGFIGGVLLVVFLMRLKGKPRTGSSADPFSNRLSSDVINISRTPVAGIGGLGLIAMALAVALDVPRIGQTVTLGLVLGAVLAAILISRRRRHGPLPSSGQSTRGEHDALHRYTAVVYRPDESRFIVDDRQAGRRAGAPETVVLTRSLRSLCWKAVAEKAVSKTS